MDRRIAVAGLAALAVSPRGESQKATSGPRRPTEGPVVPPGGVRPSWLQARLLDGSGRLLAEKRVPWAKDVLVSWPVWLLPAAEYFELTDGGYRSGWRLNTLGWAEGIFTFRVRATWLVWPRP